MASRLRRCTHDVTHYGVETFLMRNSTRLPQLDGVPCFHFVERKLRVQLVSLAARHVVPMIRVQRGVTLEPILSTLTVRPPTPVGPLTVPSRAIYSWLYRSPRPPVPELPVRRIRPDL